MSELVAALQMYDWPEVRAAVDAEWAAIRDRLRRLGVEAPDTLTRDVDMHAIWRMPNLLLAQTCWGPMETTGLAAHVVVVGQPDYSAFEGGEGELYSSAVVMRRGDAPAIRAPDDGRASLPIERMRGSRLAFNSVDSMSGVLALTRDLDAAGEGLAIFSERIESGGHRNSIVAVAEGRADVATIDCRSWDLAKRFEPASADVTAVGWTARRKGLPFIASPALPVQHVVTLRAVLRDLGLLAG